jgi:hypothetical protein
MKTIVELLATHNSQGESLIHAIIDKINRVAGCPEYPFQLSCSVSRDSSQGSMYDLRSTVGLAKNDLPAREIRELLANLQQSGILAFEEKQDATKMTCSFVITHVDEHKFLNADDSALRAQNPVFSSDLQHELIRIGQHQVDVSYTKVKPAVNYESLVLNTHLISDSEQSSHNMGLVDPARLQNIAQYLTVDKYLAYVIQLVNTCMNLDSDSGFKLYLQSSNSEYPIDLRVYLPSGHSEIANIKAKLTGFSLLSNKCIAFEEKMATGTDVVIFIIKEVMPARLQTYLKQLNKQKATPEKLHEIVDLLKANFPENTVIQDMETYTSISVSRPYPHIRCRNYYPETAVSQAMELLSSILGRPGAAGTWRSDRKPQTRATTAESGGYRIFHSAPQEQQWIIDIDNIERVEEQLRETLSSACLSEPR